jgi:hypothetical protein
MEPGVSRMKLKTLVQWPAVEGHNYGGADLEGGPLTSI